MTEYEKVPTEEPTEEFEAPPTYGEVEKSSHTEETKSMLRDIEIESVEIQPEVEDHFFKSLFATIACCMPFGLLGLYYNHRSQNAQLKGDYHRAHSYSRVARAFAIMSILVGFNGLVAYMTFMAVDVPPPHNTCPWPVEDPATPCNNLYCRLSPASDKCQEVVREYCKGHDDQTCTHVKTAHHHHPWRHNPHESTHSVFPQEGLPRHHSLDDPYMSPPFIKEQIPLKGLPQMTEVTAVPAIPAHMATKGPAMGSLDSSSRERTGAH
eukprot:Clim_evm43s242 gene=Clim_evmTU43s242